MGYTCKFGLHISHSSEVITFSYWGENPNDFRVTYLEYDLSVLKCKSKSDDAPNLYLLQLKGSLVLNLPHKFSSLHFITYW